MAFVTFLLLCLVHQSWGNVQQHSLSVSSSGTLMRNHREGEPDLPRADGLSGDVVKGALHSKPLGAELQGGEKLQQGCAPLKSWGTYYSVDIQVGTPAQTFSVVADTGSDAIIVPSCVCKEHGSCGQKERCFRGTNRSSTFAIQGLNSSVAHPKLPVISMFFGSGEIKAIVATDMVSVGGVRHLMNNSVMLMVERMLRISGPFEGILGLGPPKNSSDFKIHNRLEPSGEVQDANKGSKSRAVSPTGAIHSTAGSLDKILHDAMNRAGGNMEDVVGDIALRNPTALGQLSMESVDTRYWPFGIPKPKKKRGFQPLGFDEATHTSSFSICFNDMGVDGALNLNHPKSENSLLSIGKEHWSLDFRGISVGDSSMHAPVKFCAPDMKEDGAKTACGGIPDSGTTLIMAPMDHVEKLFGEICDKWDRCHTAVSQGLEKEKMTIFRMLLHECGSWVQNKGDKNTTLHELPDLHFRLAGKDGKLGSIKLTGDDYIMETMEDEVEMVTRNIFGMPIKIPKKTGKKKRVCAPAFSSMEMKTHDNGHVWILGGPIFYKYTVSYENNNEAPAIAFKETHCGCPSNKGALVSSDAEQRTPRNSGMRSLHQEPRLPSFSLKFENGL